MADNLSSALAAISLNASAPPRYHVLHITYPALHLLPPGVELHLDPPKDHIHRERPRLGLYHLSSSNLSFFHRFPVGSAAGGSLSLPGVDNVAVGFLAAINALDTAPGQSHLEFVSFDCRETAGGIRHLFRLKTVNSSNDQHATQHETQLSDNQLITLFFPNIAHGANSWLNLLSNLKHRTSDRAFLHVQNQLHVATNPALTIKHDILYADKWATAPSIPGSQALMSRLLATQVLPNSTATIALSDLDAENLAAHAHRNIELLLPCGHSSQAFTYEVLRAMTDSTCLHAECRACKQRILNYEQTVALLNRIERKARENFSWEQVDLCPLDGGRVASRGGPRMEVSAQEVCYVLEDMLQGFEVPESATPLALSLVRVPETRAVLHGLQLELRGLGGSGSGRVVIAPLELLGWFEILAVRTLEGRENAEMPPGLGEFIGRWLRRTVNYLVGVERVLAEGAVEDLGKLMGGVSMSG